VLAVVELDMQLAVKRDVARTLLMSGTCSSIAASTADVGAVHLAGVEALCKLPQLAGRS
jgi:hypothetical protein